MVWLRLEDLSTVSELCSALWLVASLWLSALCEAVLELPLLLLLVLSEVAASCDWLASCLELELCAWIRCAIVSALVLSLVWRPCWSTA
jgi:hypothetical protein